MEPRHVSSGSFAVDRRKALEKLRTFQLREPALFMDLCLRTASASRAAVVSVLRDRRSLRVTFDGDPIGPAELADPWSRLFQDRGARSERGRQLAFALLAAFRLGARRVAVSSGVGKERACAAFESIERQQAAPPSAGDASELAVEWGAGAKGTEGVLLARLEDRLALALLDCRVSWPGGERAPAPEPDGALAFRRGHIRGWVLPRGALAGHQSLVRVFHHGVLVEERSLELPVSVSAWVNDDRAALDASLARLVSGERFERFLALVRGGALRLVERLAALQRARWPKTASRLADPSALERWEARSAWEPTGEDLESSWLSLRPALEAKDPVLARLVRDGWLADWLHGAAERLLTEPEVDRADPVLRGLWTTPLFLASSGGTLTLEDLHAQRRRLGCALFARSRGQGPGVAWCPTARELAWLTRRFGEAVREEG